MTAPLPLDDLTRWRLILGEAADGACRSGGCTLSGGALAMDAALDWLYGRDDEDGARNISRQGGRGASSLTTPQWINDIHRLFPKETIERLERDAIERYAIEDVVTNPEVLARAEPNETLLKAVLRTKHLMAPDVLVMARKLVQAVVRKLMDQLSRELAVAFSGVVDRRRHSRLRTARNLDVRRVLRDNLKHYDPDRRRLTVERLHFFARNQRHLKRWQVILLVDQSGSMLDSVIHSAVTAACLWGLPGIRTHLVAFDTAVVDLTRDVEDPCELLMKVQLGGGTDIQQAVAYAAGLIDQPEQAIVVIISDFFEGASEAMLVQRVAGLTGQRTRVLGLAALDSEARPSYDRAMAARLVAAGAEVGAMTPGELAGWLAEKIGR
ncbi:VWA domain-containing protein [Labrys wisconsinensis]|uniref:Mg-chelatase subunit ChlD n=1 Tax=Labrys wisconsinensis TaxID=425677 RepID=A0ABU0J2R0_9HYPH|nr:VWA domain-containing protein [Labrys wisconsinensis]MDQ0468545.1 Mg-chelatase subunit ChlD [Labrys wisconsinensis]